MFEQAGMDNPKLGTVIIGILTVFISVLTIAAIERFGRKFLMLGSLGYVHFHSGFKI